MTAADKAKQINSEGGGLTENAEHWASYGIHTGEELDQYLAWCEFYELYRDVWEIKPSWMGSWRDYSKAFWEEQTQRLIETQKKIEEAEAAEAAESARIKKEVTACEPLRWNPFVSVSL